MTYTSPPIPDNEQERLEALYRYEVIDTLSEKEFDDIVILAAEICETPISVISLVDDKRQWFKAKIGLTTEETSRDISFCGHAIMGVTPFIIPDATLDPRFAENPLVLEDPSIRLYAGAPLITPDGYNIGVLCVIDNKPRDLNQRQITALKTLANHVMAQLELRRQITAQNNIQVALQRSEAKYRALSEASPLGIFGTDPNGEYNYVNLNYERISGLSAEQCQGNGWINAIHPDDKQRVSLEWRTALSEGRLYDSVHRFLQTEGKIFWARVKSAPVRENGILTGYVGTTEDITARKERNLELIQAKEAAEAANASRGQFLSNMSHEIRTPLTAIIGFAEAAQEDGINQSDLAVMMGTISRNARHLLNIINDILDLSKIDSGALKIETLPVSPVAILEEIRALMVPRIAEKALSLIVKYAWPLPALIQTDPLRLKQILLNLIGNAIKFTNKGWIEILVSCNNPEANLLSFNITDTGIGLTSEQCARLFQPFEQAEAGTARQYGGTGLGLAISKQLLNRLGGEIQIKSIPGEGSTFSFSIATGSLQAVEWISTVPAKDKQKEALIDLPLGLKGKILIADDAIDNQKLVTHILRGSGLDIKLVNNGQEAIEAALTGSFDLILLDMQMPVVDGYEVARELRRQDIKVPIIAFTANTMKHDVLKCVEAGCTTYLSKPFTKDELFTLLRKQLCILPIVSSLFEEDQGTLKIIVDFIEGMRLRLEGISQAVTNADFSRLEDEAHRLLGSANLFGYPQLAEASAALEATAKSHSIGKSQELFTKIRALHLAILEGMLAMQSTIKS